jgi:hypothetical protein
VVDDVLIIRYIKEYGLDCLELAVECKCKKFLSSPIVQSNLNNIWRGSIRETIDLV